MQYIDKLKSAVQDRSGFAHPNRFMIQFPVIQNILTPEESRDFDLFCESTSLPGRQMLTLDYTSTRHTHKKPNGYQNEDITFVFNITNDYFTRDIFTRWTNAILNRETYEVGFKDEYATPIIIHQLDEQDNKVYSCGLRDAYPVSVQNIDLNQTTTDSIQKLSVTMTYFDFVEAKTNEVGQNNTESTLPQPVPIKRNANYANNQDDIPNNYKDYGLDPPRLAAGAPPVGIGPFPNKADVKQNRKPSGGPLPNKNDVKQKRRIIPTIIPFLPPKVNQINRIARIFGVTATRPGSAQ